MTKFSVFLVLILALMIQSEARGRRRWSRRGVFRRFFPVWGYRPRVTCFSIRKSGLCSKCCGVCPSITQPDTPEVDSALQPTTALQPTATTVAPCPENGLLENGTCFRRHTGTEACERCSACDRFYCKTDASNCGGTPCSQGEVCVNNTCIQESTGCGLKVGFFITNCKEQGVPCGKEFCKRGSICRDGACRDSKICKEKSDGESCFSVGGQGTCHNGYCRVECNRPRACGMYPCERGSCVDPYCGEAICHCMFMHPDEDVCVHCRHLFTTSRIAVERDGL